MTAYRTTAITIVEDLRTLLRDRYLGGFPVLKELLQNADDARASRFLIAAHPGFVEASHPLLQSPALIVVNDGAVTAAHFDAMEKSSGGSKGGDAATVGRFGLGQKAVFHLCDAFVAHAYIDGAPTLKVMNPWEDIAEATVAASTWKLEPVSDVPLLQRWLGTRGFAGSGMCLVLPLRSQTLRPGMAHGLWLTSAQLTPAEALATMVSEGELPAVLSCLRHISEVVIEGDGGTGYSIDAKAARLSSPDAAGGKRRLSAAWRNDAGATISLIGHEEHRQNGAVALIRNDVDLASQPGLLGSPNAGEGGAARCGAVVPLTGARPDRTASDPLDRLPPRYVDRCRRPSS